MNVPETIREAFKGRSVILTGAGSGIGLAMTRLLAAAGARVYALDLEIAALNAIEGVTAARVDVTDAEAYGEAIGEIRSKIPVIDYLFNNAGVTLMGEAHKVPFEKWKWLLDVNVMGVIHGIHHVYPWMVEQRSGHIVNTASVAGSTGYATAAAYTMSKGVVIGLAQSLRPEAEMYGIRISVACPGYVETNIFAADRLHGATQERMKADLPIKMMTPELAAASILKGVARKKNLIVFPFSARFLWYVSKWAPSFLDPIHKRFLRTFRENP